MSGNATPAAEPTPKRHHQQETDHRIRRGNADRPGRRPSRRSLFRKTELRCRLRLGRGQFQRHYGPLWAVGEIEVTDHAYDVTLTMGQFSLWYAGGYRSPAAAAMGGLRGEDSVLARLLASTADREPWLADYF
ncbi:sterol carrier protein domain-containing protein [Streptomyces sp. NPDC047065]|uniref:sterol carrier protein domain-containing protein n=1 Tax=Streptomyces sp. NPDC047065 TaxID=3154606 RepID=UPI0033EAEEF0